WRATTPSWATTSGSTPTTCATRTAVPSTSRRGGTSSTGKRSTSVWSRRSRPDGDAATDGARRPRLRVTGPLRERQEARVPRDASPQAYDRHLRAPLGSDLVSAPLRARGPHRPPAPATLTQPPRAH